MAKFIRNLHEVVQPDFASEDYATQRQILTDCGLTEDNAVALLSNLWVATNKRGEAEWDRRQAERAQEQLKVEQEAQAEHKTHQEEEKALLPMLEASRVYPNKFTLVNANSPGTIPARIAITRLMKGEYVEPWYYTDDSIRAAEAAATVPSKNIIKSFRLVYDDELDTTVLVPVSSAASFPIVEDINLSWEQFMEATSRMVSCMVQSDWPQDHVNMFVEFWSSILNHQWRYSRLHQNALGMHA